MEAKHAKLGVEVKDKDAWSANLVRCCAAKVKLRARTAEELEMLEIPLRRFNGIKTQKPASSRRHYN